GRRHVPPAPPRQSLSTRYGAYRSVRQPTVRAAFLDRVGPHIFGEVQPGATMATFIMLSTLTDEGAKTIKSRPERIREVNQELEQLGASVKDQYAVLGPYDFVSVVEAPDTGTVARVSAEL